LAQNQLRRFHNNSSDLTYMNSRFPGWLRTTYHRHVASRTVVVETVQLVLIQF